MTTPQEHLLDWLRDAHAMEEQAETMLKAQAGRLEHYPALRQRIEQHIGETQGQARLLEQRIKALGEGTSTFKDLAGKTMAGLQGFGGMFATDEVVKGGMVSYAFEHFEISAYRALIAAADVAGDPETRRACEQILAQEQEMADWLENHLTDVTRQFLARSGDPDATAKR